MTRTQLHTNAVLHAIATRAWKCRKCFPDAPRPSRHLNGPKLWRKVIRWCRAKEPLIAETIERDVPRRFQHDVKFKQGQLLARHIAAVKTWEKNQAKMCQVRCSRKDLRALRMFESRRSRRRMQLARRILQRFPHAAGGKLGDFNHKVALIRWCRESHPGILRQLQSKP